MKVTIRFEHDINEDGLDQQVTVSRDGIETVEDLLEMYSTAARAGGFSYVEACGAVSTGPDRQEWWSAY
jgi:hypothetical protein